MQASDNNQNEFNLDAYLQKYGQDLPAEPVPEATAAAPPAAGSAPLSEDQLQAYINQYTDPLTGEDRPVYSNGSMPQFAIPQSPLSVAERLQLSLGNESGTIQFLSDRFEDVAKLRSGELVVKDQGLWKYVDPEGTGAGGIINRTKELVADLADAAPVIGAVGASVGVGALTGGASLVAQAAAMGATGLAAGTLRTSMGRLAGSYEASPEGQLTDIAFEGLLNTGGVYLNAGASYGVKHIGQFLSKFPTTGIGQMLKGASSSTRNVLAQVWGSATGLGEGNIIHIAQRAEPVKALSNQFLRAGSIGDQIGAVTSAQIDAAKSLVKGIYEGRGSAWLSAMSAVRNSVDDTFTTSGDELIGSMRGFWRSLGILDDAGNIANPKTMLSNLDNLASSADNPATAKVARELANDLRIDPNASYKLLKGHVVSMINLGSKKAASGARAFDLARDLHQGVSTLSRNNGNAAWANQRAGIGNFIKLTKAQFLGADDLGQGGLDSALLRKLTPDMAQKYQTAVKTWADESRALSEIIDVIDSAATRGDRAVEVAINKILSSAGRNQTVKNQMGMAVERYGQGDLFNHILDLEAVKAMANPVNNTFAKFGPILGVGAAVASGGAAPAAVTAGTLIATSPKLAGKAIIGSAGLQSFFGKLPATAQPEAVKQGFEMLTLLRSASKLPPAQADAIRTAAIQSWLQTFRADITEAVTE